MSVIGDQLGSAMQSALGQTKKAMLIVLSQEKKNSKTVISDIGKLAQSKLQGNGGTNKLPPRTRAQVLQVHYNPSSIQIAVSSDATPVRYIGNDAVGEIPNQEVQPPTVELNVELVFDDMTIADSFITDKFVGGISTQTIQNISELAKGQEHSVQAVTNGILYALMCNGYRNVIFQWGDMSFRGELTEANAHYVMFSTSGQPVRSYVSLKISQGAQDGEQELRQEEAYWLKRYEDLFEQAKKICPM